MKKAIVKQIASIADKMPIILRHTYEKHIRTGQELIDENRTEIAGRPIIADAKYIDPFPVQIAINHKRGMKKLYKRHKAAGVNAYIAAVKNHSLNNQ